MIDLSAQQIASAMSAELVCEPDRDLRPTRAAADSREVGAGDLFFGIPGARADGGRFAAHAFSHGAWGAVVRPEHAAAAARAADRQAVYSAADPVGALGALAHVWRHELGAKVIGITGSTGKTSTKDITSALLAKRHVVATGGNYNTEIGLPLTVLGAPRGTEVLVLEMGMRGLGQIAQLARIAEPDVGCVVNVGPVHLELLGTVEQVAAAKAELLAELTPWSTAVVPVDQPLLESYLRPELSTLRFGDGGDIVFRERSGASVTIQTPLGETTLTPSFSEPHQLSNLLAAVGCAVALGELPEGPVDVAFSGLRGELIELPSGLTLINDCYNANPVSMRAAIDNLASMGDETSGRRLAVLGGMAELGERSAEFHREIGRYAAANGVDILVTVGELAEAYRSVFAGDAYAAETPADAVELLRKLGRRNDVVLVKGSRSVGLEFVADSLAEAIA